MSGKSFDLSQLGVENVHFMDYVYPLVSVIIPTCNCSNSVTVTLERTLSQHYPEIEVIVVDAGSKDRTLNMINSFNDERVRITTVAESAYFEMLNKGISLSKGTYLVFLSPGQFFLSETSLKAALRGVLAADHPEFSYGGALLRGEHQEPTIYLNALSIDLLKEGVAPAMLSACVFHRDLFRKIGKFNTGYEYSGEFDFFCRIAKNAALKVEKSSRVVSDMDFKYVSSRQKLKRFREKFAIIRRQFGFAAALHFLLIKGDPFQFVKLWISIIKGSFVEK